MVWRRTLILRERWLLSARTWESADSGERAPIATVQPASTQQDPVGACVSALLASNMLLGTMIALFRALTSTAQMRTDSRC